jgi:hypothetical protein
VRVESSGAELADEPLPDLLTPKAAGEKADLGGNKHSAACRHVPGELTEEEERELDELLNDGADD